MLCTKITTRATYDLSLKHQTSEISVKTSDLMLKYQKWQHWWDILFQNILLHSNNNVTI